MITQTEPIVNFCEALFNGRSLFTSPIVERKYTLEPSGKPALYNLCWLVLDINNLRELSYSGNQIKHLLALRATEQYDDTISQLKQNRLFNDCNEQQIQNTIINLCKRLGITEQLKCYARGMVTAPSAESLYGEVDSYSTTERI